MKIEALTHERIDLFRHKILDACITAKTCAQIAKIIGGTNPRIVQFKTINLHYNRAEYPKQRLREEPPQVGHFVHRIENFEQQHRATAKLTRDDYKSARTNVGISTVYNG